MGDEITHRSVHVASVAIEAALSGAKFSAGGLHEKLCDDMDNPPSKQTVQKVLRQLREDGLLENPVSGRTEASRDLKGYRNGEWRQANEVDVAKISREITKVFSRDIEERVRNVIDKDKKHRKRVRSGKWAVEDIEE